LSRFRGTFHSFDPVGFAIFTILLLPLINRLNAFAGEEPARESDEEITFYKSIGVPIQDLVTALRIAQRARNRASAPRST
jgi:hypothetical protein